MRLAAKALGLVCVGALIAGTPLQAQSASKNDLEKKREVNRPTPPPRPIFQSLVNSCDHRYPFGPKIEPLICARLSKGNSYKKGAPINIDLSWNSLPKGTSLTLLIEGLRVGSPGIHSYPQYEYTQFKVPFLTLVNISGTKEITHRWNGEGDYCYWTDTGTVCHELKDMMKPGRYRITAYVTKPKDAASSIYSDKEWKIDSYASSRSFTILGETDWSFADHDIQYEVRDYIANKINDKPLADKHYDDGPLFTLINGKFTPQRDGLCGFYKLLSPLRGKLKVCMPRYLLTEYGFQPSRVDTRQLIITGKVKFAKGQRPRL